MGTLRLSACSGTLSSLLGLSPELSSSVPSKNRLPTRAEVGKQRILEAERPAQTLTHALSLAPPHFWCPSWASWIRGTPHGSSYRFPPQILPPQPSLLHSITCHSFYSFSKKSSHPLLFPLPIFFFFCIWGLYLVYAWLPPLWDLEDAGGQEGGWPAVTECA